jgi:hypothetical protein
MKDNVMPNFRNSLKHIITLVLIVLSVSIIAAQDHINPLTSQCWFTALSDLPTYNRRDLSEIHSTQAMFAGRSLQVLEVDDEVALVAIDHAMGFWVEVAGGVFSGLCSDIDGYELPDAVALENARIWSYPSVITGEIIGILAEGAAIEITGGAVEGRIRQDSQADGLWYPVQYANISGWVWSERLEFDVTPDVLIIDAIALENARIWSHPDVTVAHLLADVPENASLEIIGGPITGQTNRQTGATGVWYQVRYSNIVGWMWEARLQFQ